MSGQRVAILLREHLFRSRQHIPSPAALPAFRAIDASLTTRSVAWRRINAPLSAMPVRSLFASAAESIELLPAELEIVTLQHADNGGVLYISRVRSGAPDLSAAEAEQAAEGGEQGRRTFQFLLRLQSWCVGISPFHRISGAPKSVAQILRINVFPSSPVSGVSDAQRFAP